MSKKMSGNNMTPEQQAEAEAMMYDWQKEMTEHREETLKQYPGVSGWEDFDMTEGYTRNGYVRKFDGIYDGEVVPMITELRTTIKYQGSDGIVHDTGEVDKFYSSRDRASSEEAKARFEELLQSALGARAMREFEMDIEDKYGVNTNRSGWGY